MVVGARLPPEEYRRVLHQRAEDEEDAGQHPGLDRGQTLEKEGSHNIIQGNTRVVHNRERGNSQLATNRLRVLRGGGAEGGKWTAAFRFVFICSDSIYNHKREGTTPMTEVIYSVYAADHVITSQTPLIITKL